MFSAQSADVLAERDIHPLAATGELDKRRERRRTLVILLMAALARLPFLWHGFGGHPDEWYTVRGGLDFWLHGNWFPSRPLVGNPLNEIMMGGLAWVGGAPAAPAWGQPIELAAPALRPGALLWYADRAKVDNQIVARIGSELSQTTGIIRADRDKLTAFYVSSLLRRGPASEARISCPLIEATLSLSEHLPPKITRSTGVDAYRPSEYPSLICCSSSSALLAYSTPLFRDNELEGAINGFCSSKSGGRT